MFLVLDTETSGLIVRGLPIEDPAQPRICQIGAVLYDSKFKEVGTYRTLIQPDGWGISEQATATHGIKTEDCSRYGIPVQAALLQIVQWIKVSRHVIAHNLTFDEAMFKREMELTKAADIGLERTRLRKHCTMKTGTALTDDGLYPSLANLHRMLTGEDFADAHDGLSDCYAAWRCFLHLHKLKLIEL